MTQITQDPTTVIALLIAAAIALPLMVLAYALGKGKARQDNQALTIAYDGAVNLQRKTAQESGEALRAAAAARADLERSKENAAQALEQQQLNHEQELRALRAQFRPLSERDISTIGKMAEKLNLAANALHATGSFRESREAKNLASSGFRIASDLTLARALQEAA
ncbi:MAG: hypothetical protein CMK76_07445 [Pseudomonadales bacterium]|nr:hypothetical protein [Pseudomonadales bacterium]|tara:strand:+ start:41871 stop:42368 length:498 start_codon:yes stop_codon:yes gene_type:complete